MLSLRKSYSSRGKSMYSVEVDAVTKQSKNLPRVTVVRTVFDNKKLESFLKESESKICSKMQ